MYALRLLTGFSVVRCVSAFKCTLTTTKDKINIFLSKWFSKLGSERDTRGPSMTRGSIIFTLNFVHFNCIKVIIFTIIYIFYY